MSIFAQKRFILPNLAGEVKHFFAVPLAFCVGADNLRCFDETGSLDKPTKTYIIKDREGTAVSGLAQTSKRSQMTTVTVRGGGCRFLL